MSTKSSISYQKDTHHLYSEMFDEENVWVELENVEFSVERNEYGNTSVTVGIPLSSWKMMLADWAKLKGRTT